MKKTHGISNDSTFSPRKGKVAKMLLDIGAVNINPVNPFRYSSGIFSPIYINCRIINSFPRERKLINDLFFEYIIYEIGDDNIDAIVGTASSGISLATYMSTRLNLPMAYVRTTSKKHGKSKQIEGDLKEFSKVVLMTDILSTEKDIEISIKALKEKNCEILCCLAIFNNNIGNVELSLKKEEIKTHYLTDLMTLLTVVQYEEKISDKDLDEISKWMKNPNDWDENRKLQSKEFLSNNENNVANLLLKISALSLNTKNPFTHSSGLKAPIYTDCRIFPSFPKEWNEIITAFSNTIIYEIGLQNVEIIAGTSTAGISHAAYLADKLDLPLIYIKSQKNNLESTAEIEGHLKNNCKVIIIEDVVTTGNSLLESVRAVRNNGGIVNYCLSIFSYNTEDAGKQFIKENVKLFSLTNLDSLVEFAMAQNLITERDRKEILYWRSHQEEWSKNINKIGV